MKRRTCKISDRHSKSGAILSGPSIQGLRHWNPEWMAMAYELGQDRRRWAAAVRAVVKANEENSTTRPR